MSFFPGAISAVVQIPADKIREFVNIYCMDHTLSPRDNIYIHLVIQKGVSA